MPPVFVIPTPTPVKAEPMPVSDALADAATLAEETGWSVASFELERLPWSFCSYTDEQAATVGRIAAHVAFTLAPGLRG